MRLKPYKDADGAVFLDVQQLIPLPEAADYQTQIKAKEQAVRGERVERHDLRFRFWSELLKYARTKTDLHAGRNPGIQNWIGGSIGRQGFNLNYSVRERESQVDLYIDLGAKDQNRNVLNELKQHQQEIEARFGEPLDWQDLPKSRACRIRKVVPGGYRSPETEWATINEALVRDMINLDKALRPFVHALPT